MKIYSMILMIIFCLSSFNALAGEDTSLLQDVRRSSAQKDYSAAYMLLHSFADSYPEAKNMSDVLLAMGEYDYFAADYRNCTRVLGELVSRYPESELKVFACAYLLQVAKIDNNKQLQKELERSIVSLMKVSLLFRDYRSYRYRSLLLRRYKAVYFIDKVEFYVDGKILAEFAY